jgi:nucleoside-diphosphate-sugar epimerase
MAQHVIVGAGPVGTATAKELARQGENVRLVTRSGGGPQHPSIELVAADATDANRLADLATGAVALYNCANPKYHTWLTDWPPLAASLLTAAERSGATLVTAAPLYGYGPGSGVMTAATPLAATHPKLRIRADMWRAALGAHEAGRIRATEVRASDYIEANGILSWGIGAPLLAGRRAYSLSPLDVPHSWSSIVDLARTLVTVATDERAWGRAWMSPTHAPMTLREFAQAFTAANGLSPAKLTPMPYAVLWSAGLFSKDAKELRTTRYQFAKPFVMDSTETSETFGITARPIAESFRDAAEALRVSAR